MEEAMAEVMLTPYTDHDLMIAAGIGDGASAHEVAADRIAAENRKVGTVRERNTEAVRRRFRHGRRTDAATERERILADDPDIMCVLLEDESDEPGKDRS